MIWEDLFQGHPRLGSNPENHDIIENRSQTISGAVTFRIRDLQKCHPGGNFGYAVRLSIRESEQVASPFSCNFVVLLLCWSYVILVIS